MHGEKVTINCLRCNNAFTMSKAIQKTRGIKYCSVSCSSAHRREVRLENLPKYICEFCKKEFTRDYERNSIPRFCSQQCLGKSKIGLTRNSARPIQNKSCFICNKIFETRNPAKLYCSVTCQHSGRAIKAIKYSNKKCEECKNDFYPRHSASRFCSRDCLFASQRGEKSANWRGGKHIDSYGYVRIYKPDHSKADNLGYIKEHRLVMEQTLGRQLTSKETVHHINGDRTDNRPENLQLRQGKHGAGIKVVCNSCGSGDVTSVNI